MNLFADISGEGRIEVRALLALFGAAFLLRLINAVWISADPTLPLIEDGDHYWRGAQAWLDRGPFMHLVYAGEYEPQTERVPLYHIFLIPFRYLFGDQILPALIGQAFLDSFTVVVIALIGSYVSRHVGLISGALAVVWPNMIIHSGLILGDTLFNLLFTLILLFCARFTLRPSVADLIVVGLLCGTAIMTRPVAMFLPIALAVATPIIVLRHQGKFLVGCLLACLLLFSSALPIMPLVARNLSQFDTIQLTNQRGSHLLYWVVGQTIAQIEHRSFGNVTSELKVKFENKMDEEGVDLATINQFEISTHMSKFAFQEMRNIPVTGLVFVWLKSAALNISIPAVLTDPRVRALKSVSYYGSSNRGLVDISLRMLKSGTNAFLVWFVGGAALGMVGLMLQLYGLAACIRWSPGATLLGCLVIAYYLLLNGPVSLPKYRLPYESVLIIFQAIALVSFHAIVRKPVIGSVDTDRDEPRRHQII
jgi:4-amino-4-deoxy-L-arabinose transferase-like glycosyltransferase